MNNAYFEHYGGYVTIPFVTTIVCAAAAALAIITLILAICLFGKKNRGLYVINKTLSIIVLVASILMTVVYIITMGLITVSTELMAYQGGGVIGAIRDLTCGIFLAPSKFGMSIDPASINTTFIYIFYTVCMFLWAFFGYVTVIVSCFARRSSRKARNKAVAEAVIPDNTAPINNIPANAAVNTVQPAPEPVPDPMPEPAPVPVPMPEPVQTVQDDTPIDDAPIRKLVPDNAEADEKAEESDFTAMEEAVAETSQAEEMAQAPEEETAQTAESSEEAPTESSPEPVTEEKPEEKPIDEGKILDLVSAPPAENTVANDKPLFCINCGTALSGGAFCMNCGLPVRTQNKTCKNCNAELGDDARFCMVCGTKVE